MGERLEANRVVAHGTSTEGMHLMCEPLGQVRPQDSIFVAIADAATAVAGVVAALMAALTRRIS